MNKKIARVLDHKGGNYIFPFFWQHGEDEGILREYMAKIDEANMKAVCIESRPHPDFCGPQWWHDIDIILDEARKRKMKVWILDDSHFPTGYTNGAMESQESNLRRRSIWCRHYELKSGEKVRISPEELTSTREHPMSMMESMTNMQYEASLENDSRLGVYAVCTEHPEIIDLSDLDDSESFQWIAPEGNWKLYILYLSYNQGYHRNYINMMNASSCRVLINTVYESHYDHYKNDFGKTIAGFFSDEPELGNGQLYGTENYLGHDIDFPWSDELDAELEKRLGTNYFGKLIALWDNDLNKEQTAEIRFQYMDAVTRLVQKDFSEQIGNWCHEHGVEYIGHLIEDNDQHSRLGSSLGHYFRGLAGQDMAGIDDIGGQVLPQGEDLMIDLGYYKRDGEFYHYMLGNLGSSLAAIDPKKNGRTMCEIFGAYGWTEGVHLEKYLIDHFTVRGVNYFVPHAFSGKEYPDPDCPPHFYAHGNNPQYRHFGELMRYTNNVCELISDGKRITSAAVLYHGEADWMGECMFSHKIGHVLSDHQINYDYIPQDVFEEQEYFHTVFEDGCLRVNAQTYPVLFIPGVQYIHVKLAKAIVKLLDNRIKVCFIDRFPEAVIGTGKGKDDWMAQIERADMVPLSELMDYTGKNELTEVRMTPDNDRIRYCHYEYPDGSGVLFVINEGTDIYEGEIQFTDNRKSCLYDAWDNTISESEYDGRIWKLRLEPRKSVFLVMDDSIKKSDGSFPIQSCSGKASDHKGQVAFDHEMWKRSLARSIEYPVFHDEKEILLPDRLEEESPLFSGYVRYENSFTTNSDEVILEIAEAYEGVEVFLNGRSLGIQIVPCYRYRFTPENGLKKGHNQIAIEVATTLERENSVYPNMMGQIEEATSRSGIKSKVLLLSAEEI
ncbi:MAG: hypothetical protein LUD14_11180 [Clostridiales bacterium]|nr:hypothetical protein [Clostridiales bacterium]